MDKDTQDDSVSSDTGRRPYRVTLPLARLGNKINYSSMALWGDGVLSLRRRITDVLICDFLSMSKISKCKSVFVVGV